MSLDKFSGTSRIPQLKDAPEPRLMHPVSGAKYAMHQPTTVLKERHLLS